MPNRFTSRELVALPKTLSQPRFDTYLTESGGDPIKAMRLYHWNAQTSSSFLFPLHILEICVRNAVANALEAYYGANWPWASAFEQSLPNPGWPNFSPRSEIKRARRNKTSAGKEIADLRFAFWASMYTSRHQGRLWNQHFQIEFPNAPTGTVAQNRQVIHNAIDQLRELRNRIAHHEPIFRRDLVSDYAVLLDVVRYRCGETANWMNRSQYVSNLLTLRP